MRPESPESPDKNEESYTFEEVIREQIEKLESERGRGGAFSEMANGLKIKRLSRVLQEFESEKEFKNKQKEEKSIKQ